MTDGAKTRQKEKKDYGFWRAGGSIVDNLRELDALNLGVLAIKIYPRLVVTILNHADPLPGDAHCFSKPFLRVALGGPEVANFR